MAGNKDIKTKVEEYKKAVGATSILQTKAVNLAEVFKNRGIELRMVTEAMEGAKKTKVVDMALSAKKEKVAA